MKNLFPYQKIHKILSLDSCKRRLLIRTIFLLVLVKLGLSILSVKTLHKLLLRISHPQSKLQTQEPIPIENIIWAVNISTRYIPGGAKCLARALTSLVFMSRYKYTPLLYIGVAQGAGGEVKAHAWIENQGQVLVGNLPDLCDYKPLLYLTSNSSQPVAQNEA